MIGNLIYCIVCTFICAASFGACLAKFIFTKNDNVIIDKRKLTRDGIAMTFTGTATILMLIITMRVIDTLI